MTAAVESFGYTIVGERAHVPSGVPGVAACGYRIDYERERDKRPLCAYCKAGINRGRAQELRRIQEAAT